MIAQCGQGGDQNGSGRSESGLTAFDIAEFFRTEIRAESGFGHNIVGEFQGGLGGDHRVAAMGDVGKGAAMDDRWIVFHSLHQVR